MGFLDRLIEDIKKPRPIFRVGDEVENKLDSNLKFIVLEIRPDNNIFTYVVTDGKESYIYHEAMLKKHRRQSY
jgi:hypothetical protein